MITSSRLAPDAAPIATTGVGAGGSDGPSREKWYPDGTPKPFAGNSFISFDADDPFVRALQAARRFIASSPVAAHFALLPAESLHLTILDGTLDADTADRRWPKPLVPSRPIADVTASFVKQITSARLSVPDELTFTVSGVSDLQDRSTQVEVLLEPTEKTGSAVIELRQQLLDLLQIPAAAEPYRPHVTLAYRLHGECGQGAQLARLHHHITRLLPSRATYRRIALSSFADMTHFTPEGWL